MKKTDKLKMGVVLTDTFKLRRKTQFDLFAEFMGKYKMDLDEIMRKRNKEKFSLLTENKDFRLIYTNI